MHPQRASVPEETGLNPEARREKPILWAITGGNQQPRAVPLVELIWEFTAPRRTPLGNAW